MRVTAHIPDRVVKDAKVMADRENKSVSSLISEALEAYIIQKTRRVAGQKVLDLSGKVIISPQIHGEIEEERKDALDRP